MPVAFYSRPLKERERRYRATEVECLAALEAIRYFEVYVGRHFTRETDHKALEALLTSKILNRRLSRWALYLQEFNFTIRYRPGKNNGNADGLSRQAWKEVSVKEDTAGQMSTQELNIVEEDNSLRKGRCEDQVTWLEIFHIKIKLQ